MENLDWFNFCNGTGKYFSTEQKAAGWPERFEVRILAAMQSEWSFDDKKSWPILDALQTVLTKSCRANELVHLFESEPPPKERWRYFVTASDFAAWLALQHKVPSSSSAAWFTARGVDTKPQAAPEVPANKTATNKREKTLAFEADVIRLMDYFWNNRPTGTTPKKGELHDSVYNEMLRGNIKPMYATLNVGIVRDAAKPWRKPLVLPSYVRPAQSADKRHQFKGER